MLELTSADFNLLTQLRSRDYKDNSMHSNSTEIEREGFRAIKKKLKLFAEFFKKEFDYEFGPFVSDASSGNPIKFRGTKLNRVWSGIYKGSINKQYAAQISFVVNDLEDALDIGFYFGRAASRGKSSDFNRLLFLGQYLSDAITKDKAVKEKYENLIDFGFIPSTHQGVVTSSEWLDVIKYAPQNCQLVYRLHVNERGSIDLTTLTLYIKMVMFLMSLVPSEGSQNSTVRSSALTPEQRAKQAERLSLIGLKGEKFIIEQERIKLQNQGIDPKTYLIHRSLESDSYGYDILSCDENLNKIYIEVKTTTRRRSDLLANHFFISGYEWSFFEKNKNQYKLYRVYNIEGVPEFEEIDLMNSNRHSDSYRIEYNIPHSNNDKTNNSQD